MPSSSHKSMRVLGGMFLVYALLVATHLGEFWPYSIYPMFSQAGNPWTRAIVTDMEEVPDSLKWEITSHNEINGSPVAMRALGVDQIDFSNFVSKTKNWSPSRVEALRYMLGEDRISESPIMVHKVHGRLTEDDSVAIQYQPILLFTADSTYFNPSLDSTYYFRP